MDVVRRISLLATVGLLGVALALGHFGARPALSADAAKALRSGASYFDSTVVLARAAQPRGVRGDRLAIMLGYVERLRLGLGSPFRLVDEAASDPRLDSVSAVRTEWGLLARLQRGDAYVVDPAALDGIGPWGADRRGATGAAHLALIERTVAAAADPRAGELTVRLAYQLAAAQGTVAPVSVGIAAEAAALARDRILATEDLRTLLADARDTHADVISLLQQRRAMRMLRVEQPTAAALDSALQVAAMKPVSGLVAALDTLDRVETVVTSTLASEPLLGPGFAKRLGVLGAARPPLAQVVVPLRGSSEGGGGAVNEETLIAARSGRPATADSGRRASALNLLAVAVSLRAMAQDAPWFPGEGGPAPSDLRDEFGLADVSFARRVPMEWRPYYLRELRNGLRDMERVFPVLTLDGLRVHFAAESLGTSALAMHDPRTRTLQLSIATSAGTIAHELAHDLDHQNARRLFAGVGYSTDHAVNQGRGALARSVAALAEPRSVRPSPLTAPPPADRPAEIFARGADWFIASTLARQGRSNGFLSAIEDDMLAGYAAGQPAAVGLAGTSSLLSALAEMTYLPDSVQRAFADQWSNAQTVDPMLLVRRVLDAPISWRTTTHGEQRSMLPTLNAAPRICGVDHEEPSPREKLLMAAIDARARGLALRRAHFLVTGWHAPWANSLLGAAPWAPEAGERVVDALRLAIANELASVYPAQGIVPLLPAAFCDMQASLTASGAASR